MAQVIREVGLLYEKGCQRQNDRFILALLKHQQQPWVSTTSSSSSSSEVYNNNNHTTICPIDHDDHSNDYDDDKDEGGLWSSSNSKSPVLSLAHTATPMSLTSSYKDKILQKVRQAKERKRKRSPESP